MQDSTFWLCCCCEILLTTHMIGLKLVLFFIASKLQQRWYEIHLETTSTFLNMFFVLSSPCNLFFYSHKTIQLFVTNTHVPVECALLSNNILDYHIVSQGKTTIPSVDDGEEMLVTDVRNRISTLHASRCTPNIHAHYSSIKKHSFIHWNVIKFNEWCLKAFLFEKSQLKPS